MGNEASTRKGDDIAPHIDGAKARLVKFVDDFPKTPIGKIQKNFLKDPCWEEREKKI
ncbi:MAG: hypothetical protein VW547_04000 [Alphaproteobacteria bacterium]